MRAAIVVKGIVQGVGFRPFIYRIASENGLSGYVRNLGDASVEIVVEGEENRIKHFLECLESEKPSLAQIYETKIKYTHDLHEFKKFTIAESLQNGRESGSIIPYDLSICDTCLNDMRDSNNRRHNYFFTTCTECGPRYTIIQGLPYDRQNTTMQSFPMCEKCRGEYENPLDRRFHSQTIACEDCGPHVFLTDNRGEPVSVKDPIRETGILIKEGYIVAIKGNGGFHLAASTTNSSPIEKLRKIKHRAQKPFSIMSPSISIIKSFAEINKTEEALISSLSRPIVLLKKRNEYHLSELVSPQLHTIGVMLPYTGLHYLLFDNIAEPAFIMTSANAPSVPIVTDNDEALKKLASTADFMLLHNRTIAQRCDDSVMRVNGEDTSFIRRSKGYAPSPIVLMRQRKLSTLGVGAEENVNSCRIIGDKAFISQYIGDVERPETYQFHKETARHLLSITKGEVDGIGCDLHPQFASTKLAEQFAAEFDCPVFRVQHHYAHALSLMEERSVDEMIGIICDGTGYGPNGSSWGGEVLQCSGKAFTRLGHLKEQPMPGADLSARYPLRMVAGMLGSTLNTRKLLVSKANRFPHGKIEVDVIFRQLENKRTPLTSSCGRVLDAVAALLGLCYERTYEGEPAMKLESAARGGVDVLGLTPRIESDVIDTTYLLQQILQNLEKHRIKDLAYSAETYMAKGLAMLALDQSYKTGIEKIGLSGGVAYNEHITSSIREALEEEGRALLVHNRVPSGDGGIAFGQSIAASNSLE